MKTSSIKIAVVALLMATGSLGIQAQNGRGTGVCGTGTGTCINTADLTEEQQAILDELRVSFQAEMAALRAEMLATTVVTEKLALRAEMKALRDAHQAEVKDLLASWGITVNMGSGKGTAGKGVKKGGGTGVCTGTGTGTGVGTGNKYGNRK